MYVNELVEDFVGLPPHPPAIAEYPASGVTVNVFVFPYNAVCVVFGITVPPVPVTETVSEYTARKNVSNKQTKRKQKATSKQSPTKEKQFVLGVIKFFKETTF